MAQKAKRIFTVSIPEKGVILWDTTLRPLSVQLLDYDSESLSYITLFLKMKEEEGKFTFTTKSGVSYLIQRLSRV